MLSHSFVVSLLCALARWQTGKNSLAKGEPLGGCAAPRSLVWLQWYTVFRDHLTLAGAYQRHQRTRRCKKNCFFFFLPDYEISNNCGLELYYN